MFGNAKMFIKAKPPITIMILFVAALSISLFLLAVYVQHNHVLDYQANDVYSALLKRISSLTFCLTNQTEQIGHTGIQEELQKFGHTEFINITLPLTPVLSVYGNFSYHERISEIAGVIPYYLLFDADEHFHSVAIHTFVRHGWQPADCSAEKCAPASACVLMTIKKAAVPDETLPNTCNPYKNQNYSSIYMDFQKPNKNKRSQCVSGLQMNLDVSKDVGLKIYLNDFEKVKVRFRLHVAAYIFFVVLLSLLLYVIIKGRYLKTPSPVKLLQK